MNLFDVQVRSCHNHERDVYGVKTLLFTLAIPLLIAAIPDARAESPAPEIRTEVPIQQVTLSDGTIRYWIRVKIGNTSVDSLLDTGTTGLRILPDVISRADTTKGPGDSISVGPGIVFEGEISSGTVAVGSFSAEMPFQLIDKVQCGPNLPNCRATQVPFDEYGIGADGLPGEGFHALIGTKMGPSDIANPLVAIGARRWIVELPRPGATKSGKLVLNPRDDEVSGYTYIPIVNPTRYDALHDAVKGCLQRAGSTAKACGVLTFDTGASRVDVVNASIAIRYGGNWPRNTQAEFELFEGDKARAAVSFEAGMKANASQVFFDEYNGIGTIIFAGVAPYFAFDVLYDPSRNAIGLKPRVIELDMPTGRLIP
jgi:hypothetical protein